MGRCPGAPTGDRLARLAKMGGGFRAEIRAYTAFGITLGEMTDTCRGRLRWS